MTTPKAEMIRAGEVRVTVPSVGLPPAEPANLFHCTRINGDVEMLVGTVPLHALFQSLKAGEATTEITGEITHRFLMSIDAFARLRGRINELFERLPSEMKAQVDSNEAP